MEERELRDLETIFAQLEDPRIERTKRHRLRDSMIIAICAVICGADGWVGIEEFGKAKQDWLSELLDLPNGIPSGCVAKMPVVWETLHLFEKSRGVPVMSHPNPFKWPHFESEIILLCVRWYLGYALSSRDLEEMMLERGLHVDHTTIYRWVQR